MSATRNGAHDQRCEWSRTPPKRCRCKHCEGRLHGVQRVRQELLADKNEMERHP